ncbi:carboxylesterase-like protein [Talaromyces proteolyticus]|uniref:Carboxylic ester hydrolase n=1 Tax=Talaromyces proteolyticus TaxID=1131652 RepID=A0AAD4KZV1_9EURO|nr:carboxylesterase-like protein [Talaromyces proteolyticus]KAH8703171.1 carboxylesterase-like protein [Talaromyces proteolyticus]
MTETINHPLIGAIAGKAEDGIVQFLGVRYASLTDRLAEPELLSHYDGEEIDATKKGPQVISPPNGCDIEYGFLQHSLQHSNFEISDLDGLHLNITAPSGAQDLPVLVFVHGGGFALGSNAWPQYDHLRLVKLSVMAGLPILAVGINYRLGVPGFLTSEELQAAGYKPNNGIQDQRIALKWVKQYIQGFGGDANNVTLMGQSAGGVASLLHLQSEEPLFEQLIVMSGTSLALPPITPQVAETAYALCLKAMGIQELSAGNRVRDIVHGPLSKLWTNIPSYIPLRPVIDNDTVFRGPTHEDFAGGSAQVEAVLPGAKWCRRVLLGDCQSDASIFGYNLMKCQTGIANAFHNSLTKHLSYTPETVCALEQAYGINSNTTDEVALQNILKAISDIRFYAPVLAIGNNWPGETYVYHFNEPNPWEGPWKGAASHCLDFVFLFQNFNEYLTSTQQERARQFAEHVISFINGKAPFPSRQSTRNGAMVYGHPVNGAVFVQSVSPNDFGRRETILRLAQGVRLDELNAALGHFLDGK